MFDLTLLQAVVTSLVTITILYVAFGDFTDIMKKR